ncbi:MAG TPA: cytochrome c oxidase assembly protein [Solirubrobacterales bacterium]|nr:cytochrome c oxidase assembly protein [Solirubrobacterales bacterium]
MEAAIDLFWTVTSVVVPLAFAAAYLKRARTLAGQGRPVPAWRQLCFAIGILLIAVAISGPVEDLAAELVTAHMVQHLLLADLVSLLLVLGLTGPVMQPLLQNRWTRPLRHLTHPVAAISIFTFNLFLWHSPPLYQAVLHNESLHVLEHMLFIGTGVLLWMPLFGPLPKPQWFGKGAHVVYTVGIWLPAMALANTLMWSNTVFYPEYKATAIARGLEPVADQSTAGAILMVECMVMALLLFGWIFLRWAKEDMEKQRRLDLAQDRGVALDERRAQRAVAAGRGARLEQQILRDGAEVDPGVPAG